MSSTHPFLDKDDESDPEYLWQKAQIEEAHSMLSEDLPPFTDDIRLAGIDLNGIVRLGFSLNRFVDVDFDRRFFREQQRGPIKWPLDGEWQTFFGSGDVSRFQFFEKESPFNDGLAWAHSMERLSAEETNECRATQPEER